MPKEETFFTEKLLQWHQKEPSRNMPWKGEKDPYKIWLSEIMLQQTRVEQALHYYITFTQNFPTVKDLANAEEGLVLKLWQGLGYYSRARNLHFTAKEITEKYRGVFPKTYAEIRALKGVGHYTAAAISSFGYGLPYAVVDGNVIRILARYFNIPNAFNTAAGKKIFQEKAQKLLDIKNPAAYNQAIMDFGNLVCAPQNPACETCPLKKHCGAYKLNLQKTLPHKEKAAPKKHRYFHYILFEYENGFYIEQRTEKDVWRNLYQPILVETDTKKTIIQIEKLVETKFPELLHSSFEKVSEHKQVLSHQVIYGVFYKVPLIKKIKKTSWVLCTFQNMEQYAFPKIVADFVGRKELFK